MILCLWAFLILIRALGYILYYTAIGLFFLVYGAVLVAWWAVKGLIVLVTVVVTLIAEVRRERQARQEVVGVSSIHG